jgi:tetratricopeptide (TPR) repeat protein
MQGLAARPAGDQPNPAVIRCLSERARQLAAQDPENGCLQILLARLAAWQGQIDEAAAVLRAQYKNPANKPAASIALSQIYAETGSYDEAVRECLAAIDCSQAETRAAYRSRLAELYLAAGQTENATDTIAQLTSQADGLSRPAILVNMAGSLLKGKQPDKARDLLVKVASKDERNIASRLMLLEMGPAKDAGPSRQQLVDEIRQIEGENGLNWRIWQARLWIESEDWAAYCQRIESLLKECLARSRNSSEAASLLAALYEKTGQTDQAIAMYERAFKADPSDMRLARRILNVAAHTQRWDKVDQLLSSLPNDEPSLQTYYIARSLHRGDIARANDLLQTRIDADPTDYRPRLQLAGLRRMQDDAAGAQKLLADAARIAPDAIDVVAARVELCLSCSQPDRALDLCNESLTRTLRPEVLVLRAIVRENEGSVAEARKDLEEASRYDGWAERGCLTLGQLHACHGQTDEALQVWRKGLDVAPNSLPIRRSIAAVLLVGNDPQQTQGTALLEELLKERPDDEALMTVKAEFKERTKPGEAETIYEQIVRQHPASPRACERLARIAASRNQRDRAMALVDRALTASPRDTDLLLLEAALLFEGNPARATLVLKDVEDIARQTLTLQPGDEEAAIALLQAKVVLSGPGEGIAEALSFVSRKDAAGSPHPRLTLRKLHLSSKDLVMADDWIRQDASLAPNDLGFWELHILSRSAHGQVGSNHWLTAGTRRKHPDDVEIGLAAARQLAMAPASRYNQVAVSLLELMAKRVPADPDVLGQLGSVYYHAGRVEEAKSVFQRALQAAPGQVDLAGKLAWILCEHDGSPQEARKAIGDAVRVDTGTADFASLLDTSGVIEYRLGIMGSSRTNLEESRRHLEACLQHPRGTDSTKTSATFHLARTLVALDSPGSKQLLESLLADPARQRLLSPADQEEVQTLLEQLGAQACIAPPASQSR